MEISLFLILVSAISLQANNVFSQNKSMTVDMQNVTVREVISEIEKEGGISFLFNDNLQQLNRHVSVSHVDHPIQDVLYSALDQADMMYQEVGENFLVLLPKPEYLKQQGITVTGRVTDASTGESIPGVSIVIQGTTIGTTTNVDGEYQFTNVPPDAIMVFSFVGMRTQEVAVEDRTEINIAMDFDALGLEEVVMVGYGLVRKSDLTGAIGTVSGDELVKMSTASPAEALQGKVAGVSVMRDSGLPGAGYRVMIRGVTSLTNSEPLYVIDGIPSGNMDNINANDIESIEVLKDASSTAIYGSRGASGVILITTKSGRTGQAPTFNFSSHYSLNNAIQMEMTNGYENAMLFLEAHENDNVPITGTAKTIFENAVANKSEGVNHQDYVLQQGHLQEYQFSMQGSYGGKNSQHLNYYLSGSHTDEKGTLIFTNFERVSFLAKLHYSFNKNIEFGYESRYTNSKNRGLTGLPFDNPLKWALWANPNSPVLNEDGSYGEMIVNQFHENPLQKARDPRHMNNKQLNLVNIGWLQLKLLNSLTFKTTFSYSNHDSHFTDFRERYFVNSNKQRLDNTLTEQRGESTNWNWNNILTFQKLFNDHNVTIMAGHEANYGKYDGLRLTAVEGVPDEKILRYLSNATSFSLPEVFVGQSGLESFFGRFLYSYKNKYILNGILRTDGSYKFPKENRWGTFPSAGAAWIASEEQFIRDINVFDLLKFRINWGKVGNQASAAEYAYISSINQNRMFYAFDNETLFRGGIATDTPNPELQWETVKSFNIAVDMGFWDNRLTLSADYYTKDTEDMIIQVPVPYYTSNSEPYANVGDMQNKGLELSTEYRNSASDWSYSIGGNITFNKNKVLSMGEKAFIDGGSQAGTVPGNITRTEVGEEVGYFRGFEYAGIYKTQEQIDASGLSNLQIGDAIFVDQNNDGVLNADDMIKIGSPHPDFTYGLTANIQYKSFDLSVNAVGSYGNDIYNANASRLLDGRGYQGRSILALERYHPVNNPDGTIPRMSVLDPNQNFRTLSSFHMEDGSFFKIKLIHLGYTFPSSLINRIKLSQLRVFVAAQNMITFTKYSGLDPEVTQLRTGASASILSAGIDEVNIPLSRTVTFGLNITF